MLKLVEKLHSPMAIVINRRSNLFKNEDISYVSAYLASVRQKLLPYHSRSLSKYPTKEEQNKMFLQSYQEVNELFIDEHLSMGNNDYLEQCYDIFSNIHKLVRKYDIVYDLKLEQNRKKFMENDPNQFPVYNLTGSDSIPDYKTIWELKKDFSEEFEELNGHFLYTKNSKIDHPESGKGVFLSCQERKFILPGSLLGFYPGLVTLGHYAPPKLEVNSTYPYLKRYDDIWLDPYKLIPYPIRHDLSLDEYYDEQRIATLLTGSPEIKQASIPISYLNPLALGHIINHPPPDTPANIKFIDIFIPKNFFPIDFLRYLPNILDSDDIKKYLGTKRSIRAVGIISVNEIKHNEELYVDYIGEDLIPDAFRPDWLLQPPPRNPFLVKEKYFTKPNYLDKLLHKTYQIAFGKENIEFKKYITRDEGLDIIRSNANIKILQNQIRDENKLISDGQISKKLIP
jgi:hypothetical protein